MLYNNKQETGNSRGRARDGLGREWVSRSYFEASQIENNNLCISGCCYDHTKIEKAGKKCEKQTNPTKNYLVVEFIALEAKHTAKKHICPKKNKNPANSSSCVFKCLNIYSCGIHLFSCLSNTLSAPYHLVLTHS